MRKGVLVFDAVEVKGCSEGEKAALNWKDAVGGSSSVTNSAIHSGFFAGVMLDTVFNFNF